MYEQEISTNQDDDSQQEKIAQLKIEIDRLITKKYKMIESIDKMLTELEA